MTGAREDEVLRAKGREEHIEFKPITVWLANPLLVFSKPPTAAFHQASAKKFVLLISNLVPASSDPGFSAQGRFTLAQVLGGDHSEKLPEPI